MSLVLDMQKPASDQSIKVSSLLRAAMVVAAEHKMDDFARLIE